MVYEKKCASCGRLIDFGGEDDGRLPPNVVEFDDKIYCKDCVEKFVKFGIGDVEGRVSEIEKDLEEIKDQIGMEKHV